MSVPFNYIITPPKHEKNPFGSAMTGIDLVKGLRQANPKVYVPEPRPGNEGHTCIYLGDPSFHRVICAFQYTFIPEWSQVHPQGYIMQRGWRDILRRCVKHGVASQATLERIFKVNLDLTPAEPLCQRCLMDSKITSNVHASGLCSLHESARLDALRWRDFKSAAPLAAADLQSFESRAPVSANLTQGD